MDQHTFPEKQKRGPNSFRKFNLGSLEFLYGFAEDPNDHLWGHTDENRRTRVRALDKSSFY